MPVIFSPPGTSASDWLYYPHQKHTLWREIRQITCVRRSKFRGFVIKRLKFFVLIDATIFSWKPPGPFSTYQRGWMRILHFEEEPLNLSLVGLLKVTNLYIYIYIYMICHAFAYCLLSECLECSERCRGQVLFTCFFFMFARLCHYVVFIAIKLMQMIKFLAICPFTPYN